MAETTPNPERAERILDAATKLFVHYGYDKTTVSDIAKEAGISKGAIYLHWPSKEAVFEALIYRESERVVDDMIVRIEADAEAGSVFSLYQYGIVTILENPLMHAVMTSDVKVMGDFTRRWAQSNEGRSTENYGFRREMVKHLQDANIIRADLDLDVVSYILSMIRYGFLTVHEVVPPEQTPPLADVGKALAMMLDRALSPEDGGDKKAGKAVLEQGLLALRQMVRDYRNGMDT